MAYSNTGKEKSADTGYSNFKEFMEKLKLLFELLQKGGKIYIAADFNNDVSNNMSKNNQIFKPAWVLWVLCLLFCAYYDNK